MTELINPPLSSHHIVDFKVKKEPFSVYHFEDGTIYKARFILIMVHFEKTIDQLMGEYKNSDNEIVIGTGINIKHQVVMGSASPDELMGIPNIQPGQNLKNHVIEEDIDFEVQKEPFFEYEFNNGFILKGKVVLMNVDKTDIYDNNGMPVYIVNSAIDANVRLPKKTKEKLQRKMKKNSKS